MNNMLTTVVPKSDQTNYDDLIGGQVRTIKITSVTIKPGEQPASLHYENDNGKPYKPCKSMCRVLVHCWGPDANKYVGRSLMLFGDPAVVFGGAKVGGLRISHLSDINEPITMALTASRANKKPYTVKPLIVAADPSLQDWLGDIKESPNLEGLEHKFKSAYKIFRNENDRHQLEIVKNARKAELTPKEEVANVQA